jgi:hypothetical protein
LKNQNECLNQQKEYKKYEKNNGFFAYCAATLFGFARRASPLRGG